MRDAVTLMDRVIASIGLLEFRGMLLKKQSIALGPNVQLKGVDFPRSELESCAQVHYIS